jgi:hypothetical protein
MQNVFGLLKSSLGLDSMPLGTSFITTDVATLASIIAEYDLKVNNISSHPAVVVIRNGQGKNPPTPPPGPTPTSQ